MKKQRLISFLLLLATIFLVAACDNNPPTDLPDPVLVSIRIKTAPTKHLYLKYDELDLTGGKLELVYDRGPTKEMDLTSEDVTVTYDELTTPGQKTVTVKYGEFETNFFVTVSEFDVYPELIEIELSSPPVKTEYLTRETLDLKGAKLKLIYDRGPEGELDLVTASSISVEYDFSTVGKKTVKITYQEFSVEFEVNVTEPVEPTGYGIGKKKAPELIGYDFEGNEVKLSDYWGRKPVFISLWATWCPPCRAEMPHFQSLYEAMGDEFEIIAISNESLYTIYNFVKPKNFTFQILQDKNNKAFETWGTGFVPSNYMVDKWGYLYHPENISSNSALSSFTVGTMTTVEGMKAIVQGAINRAKNYQG